MLTAASRQLNEVILFIYKTYTLFYSLAIIVIRLIMAEVGTGLDGGR